MAVASSKLEKTNIQRICADYENQSSALLEILHTVQRDQRHISDDALREIADILNISHAEIHGVVSFYHDFFREAPEGRIIKICRAEACQAVGGEALADYAEQASRNQRIEIKSVYCLGNCALGPAMLIEGQLYGRVTNEKFDEIADNLQKSDQS